MDAPIENKEDFPDKRDMLHKALDNDRERIRKLQYSSEEEAIDLACIFLAHWYEFQIFIHDRTSTDPYHLEKIKKTVSEGYLDVPDDWDTNAKRGGIYVEALNDALDGKYEKVVNVLKDEEKRWKYVLKLNDKTVQLETAAGFQSLAKRLPRSSEYKFRLPYPVWLDPKYNPDASPLPLRKDESAG